MRKVAVIGSGQSGLVAAHGLLKEGYDVELYSERSPEEHLERGRPTGTAVRFSRSLAYERELGLDRHHRAAPTMEAVKMTICSHPAKQILTMCGRFGTSPLAIDLRLQSAEWMRDFTARKGRVVIERVSSERIDEIARKNDLTIVATGKDGGALFARDSVRSPSDKPLRNLAMVNCAGP